MALPFGVEPPNWLQDEIKWARTISSEGTRELLENAQAFQQIKANNLRYQSGLLGLQQQEQQLDMNRMAIQNRSAGLNEVDSWMKESKGDPVWMVNHPYTGTNPVAAEQIGQTQIRASQSLSVKQAQEDAVQFSNRLMAVSPEARAKIQQMPRNPATGLPSADQYAALGAAESSVESEQAIIEQKIADAETSNRVVSVSRDPKTGRIIRYSIGGVKTSEPPASVKLVDEIQKAQTALKAAQAAGDTASVQQLQNRIDLLTSQAKGQEVFMGLDDQGRPIVKMGKGVAASVGVPTVATQSQAQQKLLRYENTIELMSKLDRVMKPEHLGVRGVLGEWVMDRGLSQLIPEVANKERIEARSALVAMREGLMRELSNDPRFSNLDREEIAKALPSSGMFESYSDAQQRINTVRNIITQRAKVYAEGLGQKPPLWTLSAEEIREAFQSGSVTQQEAISALQRFH